MQGESVQVVIEVPVELAKMTDSETIAGFARRQAAYRRSRVRERERRLRGAIPALARRLVHEFGAHRVILFGSLAWGAAHEDSDIDLAVEGLRPELFFRALGELLADAPAPVDLVDLEHAPEALRERILSEGMVVDV